MSKELIHSIATADLDSKEHEYIVDCLKSAVAYCKSQFVDSNIDWLPTVNFCDTRLEEADKFAILEEFISNL